MFWIKTKPVAGIPTCAVRYHGLSPHTLSNELTHTKKTQQSTLLWNINKHIPGYIVVTRLRLEPNV